MEHKAERPRWLRPAKVLSLLLAAVLCVVGLTQAFAEGELSPRPSDLSFEIVPTTQEDGKKTEGTWILDSESGTVIGMAFSNKTSIYDSFYTPETITLKITNRVGKAIRLSFEWRMEDEGENGTAKGSVDVAGDSRETGTYSGTLQANGSAGESIQIMVTSPKNSSEGTNPSPGITNIYLSNFNVESATDASIALWPAEGGSYTVTTGGQSSKTVESNGGQSTYGFMSTTGIEVSAAPADGMEFYMWWDPNTKIPYSTRASVSLHPNGTAIQPIFVKTGERQPNFLVQNGTTEEQFIYWQDAMLMAAASKDINSKTVILGQSYELPKDVTGHDGAYVTKQENGAVTYSLPSKVTLVVPYDESNNTSPNNVVNTEGKDPGHSKAFRTLTVPAGVKLDVPSAATLILNAVQGGKTGASSMGRIIGDYAEMKVSGSVEVTGTLYARGFVTGTGQVTAHSSSTIYQLMQIQDWRGGGLTFSMYGELMAINMYTFENIMTPMTYEGGSTLMVQACVAHGSNIAMSVDVAAMADGTGGRSSIFVLDNEGEVRTTYDSANDRLNISITKGTVKMGFLALEISMGTGDKPFVIDSAKYPLAVNDSMSITVKRGATLQTDYDLKFLPGTVVTVEEGAQMIVSENSHLYFYSRNSYKNGYADNQERTRLDYDVIQEPGTTVTSDADATLEMHGELVLQGTLMQSADGEGGLTPYKNAQVTVVNTPVQTAVVNECYGKGQAYNDSATGATSVKKGDSYYVEVKSWRAIKGRMAESAVAYGGDDSFTSFAEVGTYKTIDIDGTLYWYQYQVDYTYELDAGVSGVTVPSKEITYISKSTANHAVASAGGQQFVAVAGTAKPADVTVTAGEASVNKLADGAEDVALANVTADTTVALIVKPYTHKVTWEVFTQDDAKTADVTFDHYVTGTEDSYILEEGATDPTVTIKPAGGATGTYTAADRTMKITGISEDIVVTVYPHYNAYKVLVEVVIPDAYLQANLDFAELGANPEFKDFAEASQDVTTGKKFGVNYTEKGALISATADADYFYSQVTYVGPSDEPPTFDVTKKTKETLSNEVLTAGTVATLHGGVTEGCYIIDNVQFTSGSCNYEITTSGETLKVKNITMPVTVRVTLKHVLYKAEFSFNSLAYYRDTKNGDKGLYSDVPVAAGVYFNPGETITLPNEAVECSNIGIRERLNWKYLFIGCESDRAKFSESTLTYNTAGLTNDDVVDEGQFTKKITIPVTVTYYDFIARLQTKDGTLIKNIYMQDYVTDLDGGVRDGETTYYRYDESRLGAKNGAPLPYDAEAQKTKGTSKYSYMSYTYTFDGAVSLNEMGESGELYTVSKTTIPNGATTQDIDSLVVSAANAETGGNATVTIRAKSYYNADTDKQTAITENCVVTVDPVAYDHIVTFVDESGNQLAKQYVAGDTATYTAAANTVITAVDAGSHAYTNTGTAVTVSGLTGNPKITLTTAKYDSCVTWSITKDGTQYTANQFIVNSSGTYKTVALLGDNVSALAGIAIDGSNAVLTAGNKLVVANGATYTDAGLTWKSTTITVPAHATGTVTLTLKAYDHKVTFKQGEAVLETQYVKENANVITNGHVFYNKLTDKVITGYTISGDGVDTATAAGGTDESTEVQYGWSIITIGNITSDLTVDLTTKDYAYQLQWIIQSPGNTANETLKPRYYSESETPEWTADSDYLIASAVPTGATATPVIDGRTVKLTKVAVTSTNKRVTATVTLKSAVTHLITYTVNGGTATVADPTDSAWTYTPDSGYEITGAVVTGDAGVIVTNLRTSLTITGITAKPITVAITTAQTTTEPTAPEGEAVALWGDMSYQYYRCASVYRWNGTDANNGQWTPADTFAWRHSAGSRSYTVGGKSYTVPNGSIMLLNNTAADVTYTVQLVPNTSNEALLVGMTWTASSGTTAHTEENQIVVTVPAHSSIYVSGEMHTKDSVTVPNDLSGVDIGHITVGTATVSEN